MAEGVPPNDSASVPSPLTTGTRVGNYKIGRILRHDELGITYTGRDMALERDVAITEYLPLDVAMRCDDSSVVPCSMRWAEDFHWGRNRFLAEARILGELAGTPAVVAVHDSLEANGTAYMVTRRVRGQTLASRLARHGTLSCDAVERLLAPLLEGLERAHARGLLHLGITPSTIMLDREDQPTLIDFRAVAVALAARRHAATVIHTPGYAAIELVSDGHTGPATDIHALAATLYRCVTGAVPAAAINRLTERMIPATQQAAGRYPYGLLAAIDAGVAFRSADRPVSIAAWRPVFDTCEPVPVPPDVAALAPFTLSPHPEPEDALEPPPGRRAKAAMAAVRTALASRLSSVITRADVGRMHEAARVTLAATQRVLSSRLSLIIAWINAGRLRERMRVALSVAQTALGDRLSLIGARARTVRYRELARTAFAAAWTAFGEWLTSIVVQVRARGHRAHVRIAFVGLVALAIMGGLAASNALRSTDEQASVRDRVERHVLAEEQARVEARARTEAVAKRQQEEEAARAEIAARQAAEETARAEAEMKRRQDAARRLAAEKAQAEAEARVRAETEARRRQEEETARRIMEEKARAEAEARQKAEAEAKARAEAEAKRQREEAARDAAEERVRAEAEARLRAEAEAKARAEAEAKRQQEEAARRAAEERARAEAEARQRAEADAKARADQAATREQADATAKRQLEEARKAAAERIQAAADARQQAEAAERALALSPRDRRRVQVALTSLGFDTAGVDEVFGPRTRQMVGLWQKRQGASDTGFLTGPQLAALSRQAAPALARYDAEEARSNEKRRRVELADTTVSGQPQAATTVARRSVNDAPAVAALAPPPGADPALRSEEYRGSQRVLLYGGDDPRMYAEYTLILRVAGSKVSGVVTRYCPACAPNGGEERKNYPCNVDTLRFGSGFSLHCEPITVWGDLESARIHHSANLGGIAVPLVRTGRGG